MKIRKRRFSVAGASGAVLAVALIAAGCGSSSTSTSTASSAPAASSASSTASNAAASGAVVKVTHGAKGVYLTDGSGRALYLWAADPNGRSTCSGACAQAWPPLTTKGAPTGSGGIASAKLTTITRSNGAKQVVYNGHPLYYFAGDTGPGTTSGQGSNSFGAKWWLVTPAGAAVTTGASAGGGGGGAYGSSSSSSGGWG
jgi:predicted lipoprotein with Yx(FWY)xxD motif